MMNQAPKDTALSYRAQHLTAAIEEDRHLLEQRWKVVEEEREKALIWLSERRVRHQISILSLALPFLLVLVVVVLQAVVSISTGFSDPLGIALSAVWVLIITIPFLWGEVGILKEGRELMHSLHEFASKRRN